MNLLRIHLPGPVGQRSLGRRGEILITSTQEQGTRVSQPSSGWGEAQTPKAPAQLYPNPRLPSGEVYAFTH